MKLSELDPSMFALGLRIYLRIAYDGRDPPESAAVDVAALQGPDDVRALFAEETPPNPGGETHRHLVMRLGNSRYPHMKIALMEFMQPGEWFWSVDTHDRAEVDRTSPDWEAWCELQQHNLQVKETVERAWREAGIPTARVVARERLAPVLDPAEDGPLILVVDDEEGIRSVAVNILQSEGYRVAEAESAAEALEMVADLEPDLVLMDFAMPEMDGAEACERIRAREAREGCSRTRVLLATAGQMKLSERQGADGFLMKPYHKTLLLSFVAHQLPGKNRGSGSNPEPDGPGIAPA